MNIFGARTSWVGKEFRDLDVALIFGLLAGVFDEHDRLHRAKTGCDKTCAPTRLFRSAKSSLPLAAKRGK